MDRSIGIVLGTFSFLLSLLTVAHLPFNYRKGFLFGQAILGYCCILAKKANSCLG